MSDAPTHDHHGPHGTSLLPRDLTDEEFAALPILELLDELEIDDLTDDEYETFIAALSSCFSDPERCPPFGVAYGEHRLDPMVALIVPIHGHRNLELEMPPV